MKLTLIKGDITKIEADAIVNPANSYGRMGGGVAGAILAQGGKEIEKEAMNKAPIPVGHSILTTSGRLKCHFVIHAPTMKRPAERATIENIKKSTKAALRIAEDHGFQRIAFPGMGTGVGGLSPDEAAMAMLNVIKAFPAQNLKEILLVAYEERMNKAFQRALIKDERSSRS